MARKEATEADPPRQRRPLFFAVKLSFWGLVAYIAGEGGEYGTSGLITVRARNAETKAAIDSLKRVSDSLAIVKHDVTSNPAVQERIAREEFGMVKGDRELVFHLLRNDSSAVSPDSAARVPTP